MPHTPPLAMETPVTFTDNTDPDKKVLLNKMGTITGLFGSASPHKPGCFTVNFGIFGEQECLPGQLEAATASAA